MSGKSTKFFYLGLPPASIFEKIRQYDLDAPESIIDYAEKIQERRHLVETREMEEEYQTRRWQFPSSIVRGLRSIFNALVGDNRPPIAPPVAADCVQTDWTHVGNDIRESIRSYLDRHPRIYAEIRLTAAEEHALQPVPVSAILKAQQAFTR